MSSQNPGAKSPFDPLARHVDQETGLEYEDIAAKICGRPADSTRNGNIRQYRRSRYTETAIRAYWRGFDGPVDTNKTENRFLLCKANQQYGPIERVLGPSPEFGARHTAGIAAAKATGCWGPAAYNPKAHVARNAAAGFYTIGAKNFGVPAGKRANLVVLDDISAA